MTNEWKSDEEMFNDSMDGARKIEEKAQVTEISKLLVNSVQIILIIIVISFGASLWISNKNQEAYAEIIGNMMQNHADGIENNHSFIKTTSELMVDRIKNLEATVNELQAEIKKCAQSKTALTSK